MMIPVVVIEGILYLTLFSAALLFGGGFIEGYTLLEISSAFLVGLAILLGVSQPGLKYRVPLYILFAWAVFLCFQLIPLPLPMARILSPKLVELLETFSPGGLAASHWLPISMNTYTMKVEIGKLFAFAGLFFASFCLIGSKVQIRRLSLVIIGIGFVLSLLGLVFYQMSPDRVYAWFAFPKSSPFTPYLNKNHFANYLVMSLPLVLAYMVLVCDRSSLTRLNSPKQKILWLFSKEATPLLVLSGICLAELTALLAAASRGALFGFAFALFSFGLFFMLKSKSWLISIIMLSLVAFALWMGIDLVRPLIYKMKILQQMSPTDFAVQFRLSNWRDTFKIFLDFPIAGIGAGNFHELFPLYKSLPELDTFSQINFYYAENEFLQALGEVGLIGTGILIVFWITSLLGFLKWWPTIQSKTVRWLSLGIFSSCIGMTAHSFFDFTTHLPANMALFAVLGGVLTRLTSGKGDALIEHPQKLNLPAVASLKVAIKMAVIAASFMVLIPILWRQWASEHYYVEAQKGLSKITQDKLISTPALTSSYENLMKAKKFGDQTRIHHALGRAFIYFGLLEQKSELKRQMWFQKAEESIKKSISRSPWKAEYHYTLAHLYELSSRPQSAEPLLQNAAKLEPKNPFYTFQLGRNQLKLGNDETASILFKETLAMNGTYLEPILEELAARKIPLEVDYLYDLIPEDKRALFKNQIFRFFEAKGDLQTAESFKL